MMLEVVSEVSCEGGVASPTMASRRPHPRHLLPPKESQVESKGWICRMTSPKIVATPPAPFCHPPGWRPDNRARPFMKMSPTRPKRAMKLQKAYVRKYTYCPTSL
ncbi:hypothetical protein TNIN_304991 [Trichonephila inaurata madagascariensis]|uniref:Uncharacterized protein n=1 Tax=Trichonephila inaurata madagascariensis TaxID=2747483 RepID=A0A8X6MJG1_9ARAC|nr:hypothetical protein TNIN_304991 [Trichonephila inaurata madagascariensis]